MTCVCVASLLAPKPHLLCFFVLIGLDIVKALPRCYLQTYIEESVCFFMQKNIDDNNNNNNNNNTEFFFDALAMNATASFIREKTTQNA